jgi:hypothetical protein
MNPEFVVVDTADGYLFFRDFDGKPFTEGAAFEFTDVRNYEQKIPTYKVFQLTERKEESFK